MHLPPYGIFLPPRAPTPQLADWKALIIWSEVYGGAAPTKAVLVAEIQRLEKYRGLRLIAAINARGFADGAASQAMQMQLVGEYTHAIPLRRPMILREVAKGRILLAEETLAILAGYVIQHGAIDEPSEALAMNAFINAILMTNELFGEEQIAIQKAIGGGLESFLPVELRAAALETEPMDHLVARLHTFIKWARAQDTSSKIYLDIDDAFVTIFGRSYEEVTAAGFIVRHYFRSIATVPELANLDPIMDIEFLVAPLENQAAVRDFLNGYSIPILELAQLLGKRDRMTAAALLPLQQRPLVDLGQGLFACPSLTFLSATLGIGLFHRLADYFGAKSLRLKFYHFFGRFLEAYVRETIAAAVRRREATVVPEFEYRLGKKRRKSSDALLLEGRRAIFFDVCTKRLNTELSLNAGDIGSMRADIDAMILCQAKQLDGRIADFRAGAYTIEGVTSADVDTIIPVAVTHQSIHGWAATRRFIDQRLAEKGWLQGMPRLEIVSIAELEMLVQAFDGDLSFADLLTSRSASDQEISRSRSLKNFLLLDGHWDGKDRCPNAGFTEWFDNVAVPHWKKWRDEMAKARAGV